MKLEARLESLALGGRAAAAGAGGRATPGVVAEAARQFEALLIQQVLKSAHQAGAAIGEAAGALGPYQDLFDQQLALQLSRQGGLGLAQRLAEQLGGAAPAAAPAPLAALPLPRALPTAPAANDNRSSSIEARRFVQQMRPHAERAAARLGVPAELLLAQAALETGWGSRLPRHADGRESHNYFGIKADRRWQGEAVRTRTREVVDGQSRSETAAFRAYASVGQGFEDYAHFLQSQPRYAEALKVAHDPRRFAEGLQKAGYATDPDYAEKILRVMADPALHEGRRAL